MPINDLESCDRCVLDRDEFWFSCAVGDKKHYQNLRTTNCWWNLVDVTTLGRLLAHHTHREDVVYLPIVHLGGLCPIGTTINLPGRVDIIVSTAVIDNDFATIKIFLKEERAEINYGQGTGPVTRWEASVLSILRSCRVCDELTGWNLVGISFIEDGYNCGPRACVALLKEFQPLSVNGGEMDGDQCRKLAVDKLLLLLQWSGAAI
jgi:hypothetical protein